MNYQLTIQINTDNAAFEDKEEEISRLLKEVSRKIENGISSGNLKDLNGNNVGNFDLNESE